MHLMATVAVSFRAGYSEKGAYLILNLQKAKDIKVKCFEIVKGHIKKNIVCAKGCQKDTK